MMKRSSSIFVLVAAVGCGGGKNGPNVLPDAAPSVDSPPQVSCLLSDTGTATALMQAGFFDLTMNPDTAEFQVLADINSDSTPDIANILLFAGFGAFMNGVPAGATTIELTGVEAQFQSCGACALIITDIDMQGMSPDTGYIATSGTMNLQVATQQRLQGTITNATFTHVNIDDMTAMSTPHPDGCTATVGQIAFDTVPTDANMMKRNGKLSRAAAAKLLQQ